MENQKASFNYPFAKGENGMPVFIDGITNENRHSQRYTCYGCGKQLFPVLAKHKKRHFRHEKGCDCDPDRYLHEFAKEKLKERFDKQDKFVVQYFALQKCKKADRCEFYEKFDWPECEHEGLYSIDLKEYYDTCAAEKGYYTELPDGRKKYIADLILTHSMFPNRKPTTLEIWVHHECTEDKKKNGGHIIEIKVSCEKDVDRAIVEDDGGELPIRFFNFKKQVFIAPNRKFKHFKIVSQQGRKNIEMTESLCSEGIMYDPQGEHELILSQSDYCKDSQTTFYKAKLNEKSINAFDRRLCEYGRIIKKSSGLYLSCPYLQREGGCPCRNYKYDDSKGNEMLKLFEKIPYWEHQHR